MVGEENSLRACILSDSLHLFLKSHLRTGEQIRSVVAEDCRSLGRRELGVMGVFEVVVVFTVLIVMMFS